MEHPEKIRRDESSQEVRVTKSLHESRVSNSYQTSNSY